MDREFHLQNVLPGKNRTEGINGNMTTTPYDTIVIGSGIGGMATSRMLAEYGGHRVLLLEQHFKPGGLVHTFERQGKYRFGIGLHYVGLKGEKDFPTKIMDYMADGKVAWEKLPDNYDNFVYPGMSFSASSDQPTTIARLKEQFPDEARALDQFYKNLSKNMRGMYAIRVVSSMPWFLKSWLLPWVKWRFPDVLKTANAYLDESFQSNELKAILSSVWGDMGVPPSRMAYGYLAILHWHYEQGASFPVGGVKTFSQAILDGIKSRGVDILTRRYVEEILIENGRAVGVKARNKSNDKLETYHAEQVVSDAGAYNTYVRMLPAAIQKDYKEELEKLCPSISGCILFVGLKDSPKTIGLDGGNIWMYPSFDHDENYNAPPGEGLLYLSFPSMKDPDAAHHTVEILTLTHRSRFEEWKEEDWPRKNESYVAHKESIAKRIIERIDEKYQGFAQLVDYQELATPLTFETFQNSPLGQFYGLPVTKERILSPLKRARTPIKGLYLAGQDVTGPGMVPGLLSGLEVTTAIITKGKVLKMIRDIARRQHPCPTVEVLKARMPPKLNTEYVA
uniref:Phytoene dehydrogenase-related protein n=1 Tax=Candidatus Kentrum sp. LFY TaxID=2126342 RepID=A0A450UG94_9GAMM|nr:MAG: Phytoene dehydrogenase-related protein [Candidatus Kentron sp. LFY]